MAKRRKTPKYIPFQKPHIPASKKKEKKKKEKKFSNALTTSGFQIHTYPMEQYQIWLADSEDVIVAAMLESEPSDPIKQSLFEFSKDFRTKYEKNIREFLGKLSDFDTAKELVNKHFNLFLIQPIKLPTTAEIKKIKLNSDEKFVVKIAKIISKERGFFFMATLIDNIIKQIKISEDNIIKAIFSLNRKGIFKIIDIE